VRFGIERSHQKNQPNFWRVPEESAFGGERVIDYFDNYDAVIEALVDTYKYEKRLVAPFVSALFEGEGREIFGVQSEKGFSLTLDAGSCFGALFGDEESASLDYEIKKTIDSIDWMRELRPLKMISLWGHENLWSISRFGELLFVDLGEAFRKAKAYMAANRSKLADPMLSDRFDLSIVDDFFDLIEFAPSVQAFHQRAKLILGDDYKELGKQMIKEDLPELMEKFDSYFDVGHFGRLAMEKSQRSDWAGLIKEAEAFLPAFRDNAVFWTWIGKAHRELGQNPEAGTAFLKSLKIDLNNIEAIQLLGSSCFLASSNNVFYNWINENIKRLDHETQLALVTYLETNWKGYLDAKYLESHVLSLITKWRNGQEDVLLKELEKIGLKNKSELLPVLQACKSAHQFRLLPGVLGLGLTYKKSEIEPITTFLISLLDDSHIRFEDVPKELQEKVMAQSAETSAKPSDEMLERASVRVGRPRRKS
jgi:tetratricopeptide (TPR) repeat protein